MKLLGRGNMGWLDDQGVKPLILEIGDGGEDALDGEAADVLALAVEHHEFIVQQLAATVDVGKQLAHGIVVERGFVVFRHVPRFVFLVVGQHGQQVGVPPGRQRDHQTGQQPARAQSPPDRSRRERQASHLHGRGEAQRGRILFGGRLENAGCGDQSFVAGAGLGLLRGFERLRLQQAQEVVIGCTHTEFECAVGRMWPRWR